MRRRQMVDGRGRLARGAAFLLSISKLSREGRAYATTLQYAAESYLSFRRGDHADARARMVAAVQATDQLASWWGESEFIARRRVHLAHNLMRVDAACGAARDAMLLGARLLACLAGCSVEAPLPGWPASIGALMGPRQTELYFNLVAQTAAELLAPLRVKDARELFALTPAPDGLGTRCAWRGRDWLEVKAAALRDEAADFVERAQPFLRAGRGDTPTLWHAVAVDLVRAHNSGDSTPDPTLLDEIFEELATAPRVPLCMRSPGRTA